MIRFDSLLVRALADALDSRFAGRTVRALRLDPAARQATFVFARQALLLQLDPRAPAIRTIDRPAGRIDSVLPTGLRVRSASAPADERIVVWSFDDADTPQVFVEFMTNRLNLLVVGPDRRIRAVLAPREGARRTLVAGEQYELPAPTGRAGASEPLSCDDFVALLASVEPVQRVQSLVRSVAWTSPLNASAIMGDAAERNDPAALQEAWSRYRAIVAPDQPAPCTLEMQDGAQPYPLPLPGLRFAHQPDLLAAFDVASEGALAAVDVESALARLLERQKRLDARTARLKEEAAGAATRAAELRRAADLLLAQVHAVRKGDVRVELDDFAGGTLPVNLDPALSATENATKMYDAARKRERAAHRLPGLLARAEREATEIALLIERVTRGEVDAREVAPQTAAPTARGKPGPALPYRAYRTSGGLEVRVGRGSKSNDKLTFHHARPDDVWMHARDAAGAHVVLRWDDRTANPPAADLHEAAILVALHSKARTSGVVPVDWTRRKYVRKPRKAPPGRVIVERTRTIFVEPDERVEIRMRAWEGSGKGLKEGRQGREGSEG